MTGAGDAQQRTWPLALALAGGMVASTLVQYALGPFLREDLGLTRTELGLASTALFASGTLMSPAVGWAVDHLEPRALLAVLFVAGGLAPLAIAGASGLPLLLAAAAFGGLPLALGNAITNALIGVLAPPARQGMVTAVKQSGVQSAAFLAGAALPPLAVAHGWRRALVLGGTVVVAVGVVAFAVLAPRVRGQIGRDSEITGIRLPLPSFVRPLSAYAFLMGTGVAVVGAYVPLYGAEEPGMSARAAGFAASIIGLTAVVVRLLGRAGDRGVAAPPVLAWQGLIATVAALAVMAAQRVPLLLWLAVVGLGASAVAWNGLGMLAVVRGSEPGAAGRASGRVLLGFFGGLVAGPPMFGAAVDATGSWSVGWAGVAVAFALAGLVATRWARGTAGASGWG